MHEDSIRGGLCEMETEVEGEMVVFRCMHTQSPFEWGCCERSVCPLRAGTGKGCMNGWKAGREMVHL